MPLFDLPLAELRQYRTTASEPADLDAFWSRAIETARSHAVAPVVEAYRPAVYGDLSAFDVTFSGADGDPVKGWYLRPASAGTRQLPCRVAFVGYGGGRDLPTSHTLYPACGFATFVMDTRAQGGTWARGDTPDPARGNRAPSIPG